MPIVRVDNVKIDDLLELLNRLKEKSDIVDIIANSDDHSVVINPVEGKLKDIDGKIRDEDIEDLI